jgi:hypothetical protein
MQISAFIQKLTPGSTVNRAVYTQPPSELLFAAFTIASRSST